MDVCSCVFLSYLDALLFLWSTKQETWLPTHYKHSIWEIFLSFLFRVKLKIPTENSNRFCLIQISTPVKTDPTVTMWMNQKYDTQKTDHNIHGCPHHSCEKLITYWFFKIWFFNLYIQQALEGIVLIVCPLVKWTSIFCGGMTDIWCNISRAKIKFIA